MSQLPKSSWFVGVLDKHDVSTTDFLVNTLAWPLLVNISQPNRYSLFYLFQKWSKTLFILLVRVECSTMLSSYMSLLYYGPSGRLIMRRPVMRCEGVTGSSTSSVEMYVRGRELTIISTSVTAIVNSSKVNIPFPIVFLRQCLTNFTNLSKIPPHHGAFSKLKVHWTRISVKYSCTSGA